ncbi:MAG: efflux RND transporter periplasmic adaptor subunit [Desulfocapsaceae bacterium]|jgi:RND family efflux transporter MFP subunit|nr:efflux RND transporter periplasmic adaptor subunit [Desulfocapsaceae bacterium]
MKKTSSTTLLRIVVILTLALAMAAVIFFRMSSDQKDQKNVARRQPVVGVRVAPVERRDLVEIRIFSGTLEAEKQYDAAVKVGGRIKEIAVSLGECLKKGDLIARLDSEEYEQQFAQAQAELDVAQASLAKAKSMLEAAERNYQRAAKLREQKVSSVAELEAAETERLTQLAGVNLAQAQINQRQAALRAAEVRLSYTMLRADWQGNDVCRYVADRYVDEGDTIAANATVVTLVDLSLLRAVINVAEREYAFLKIGQQADISVDSLAGRTFPGTVVRMAPVFDEASRQARVEISVPNPDSILKGGMFARVHIELARAEQALAVPSAALIQRQGVNGVFVVEAESARFADIETGIKDGDWTQLTGLTEGQQVVTLGHHLLSDGVRVAPSDGNDEIPRRAQK